MSFGTAVIIVSIVWLASEIFLSRIRRSGTSDSKFDRSSMRIIWIVIAVSVNAGVFLGLQQFGHFGAGAFVIQVSGFVLIVCGLVLRWVAILTLRRQFTVDVAITEHHRLVTEGVYRYLRHPSYAGSLISFLGLGMVFANYISILVILLPIAGAFLYRIRIEEQVLVGNFGTGYLNYCSSTKRLIPFIF